MEKVRCLNPQKNNFNHKPMIKSLVLVAMLYTPQEDSVSNEVYMASLHIIKDVMETKKNCKFNKRKMKTYYIELDCGDATVYAPNENRAVINFFNYMRELEIDTYTIKKDKGELKLYGTYYDKPTEIYMIEVNQEGVITYVEH